MLKRRIVSTVVVLLAAILPGSAAAARPHRHHHRPNHHRSHVADVQPGEATWQEWREDMLAVGFTPDETTELEMTPAEEAD